MKVACIVPAAGRGVRMGTGYPGGPEGGEGQLEVKEKPYLLLGDKPILAHTLIVLENCEVIDEVVVVVSRVGKEDYKVQISDKYGLKKAKKVLIGGPTRSDSVYNGLKEVDRSYELVLIHDGTRPFVTKDLVNRVVEGAREFGACIPAVRVVPTIKEVNKDFEVAKTLSRDRLWAVQTPQAFGRDLILRAYEVAGQDRSLALDDSYLVEKIGHRVKVVEGSEANIKVTTSEDLLVAEKFLERSLGENGAHGHRL